MVLRTELGSCHKIGSNSWFHNTRYNCRQNSEVVTKLGAIQGFTNTRWFCKQNLGGCHKIGSNSRFHHYKVILQSEFGGCHKIGSDSKFCFSGWPRDSWLYQAPLLVQVFSKYLLNSVRGCPYMSDGFWPFFDLTPPLIRCFISASLLMKSDLAGPPSLHHLTLYMDGPLPNHKILVWAFLQSLKKV